MCHLVERTSYLSTGLGPELAVTLILITNTPYRVRKQKERYAVTELRKQQNRMNFGEIGEDLYQEDLGVNRGNIGKGGVGGGSLRMAQVKERYSDHFLLVV